jgi:hypothetical protein
VNAWVITPALVVSVGTAAPSLGVHRLKPRAACAQTRTFVVVNETQLPRVELERAERAVEDQSVQLRRYWQTPCAAFTAAPAQCSVDHFIGGWCAYDGWPVFVEFDRCSGDAGCHAYNASRIPYVEVSVQPSSYASWTVVLSHEVLETLVDPFLARLAGDAEVEVCDPAYAYSYRLDGGVLVSDFTLPAFWRQDWSAARWDELGVL